MKYFSFAVLQMSPHFRACQPYIKYIDISPKIMKNEYQSVPENLIQRSAVQTPLVTYRKLTQYAQAVQVGGFRSSRM
jgi:hypothetical protein